MGFEKRGLSKINLILIISVVVILFGLGVLIYNLIDSGDKVGDIGEESGEGVLGVVTSISEQCNNACDSGEKTDFCDFLRTVDGSRATCEELATSSQYSSYNVQACSTISCAPEVLDQTCVGIGGTWVNPTDIGACPSVDGRRSIKLTPSDSPPELDQICCG